MRNQRGFNLIGVIIAAGLFAMLALAVSEFFANMFKSVRAVDVKIQSQDFGSLLRLSMAKQDVCIQLLGLDKTPHPLEFPLTEYQKAEAGKEISIPVPSIMSGGRTYAKDTPVADLKIVDISLLFSAPISAGNDEHIGGLSIPMKMARGTKMTSIAQYLVKVPMRIKVEKNATAGTAKIVACNSEAPNIDPQVVCMDLGGRWLDGTFMPKARCNVGGDIVLAINELPDSIPDQGGSNDEGERVETCFYQKSGETRVQEFLCPNTWGNRSGPRCAFDKKTHLWGVTEFNKLGQPKKLRYTCMKGVKVSVRTPETAFLEVQEPLYLGWGETAPLDMENPVGFSPTDQDRLTAVSRCQILPDAENFQDCSNTAANALQGKVGSCVYVKGVHFSNGSTQANRIAAYNALNGTTIDPKNFTGWVKVTSARASIPKAGNPPFSMIREAKGHPCFRAELRLSNAAESGLAAPEMPLADTLKADPTQIQHCVHEAVSGELSGSGAAAGSPPTRKTIFPCDNSSLSTDELTDMAAGQCWYLRDTRIIGYHEGGSGGNTAAPATGGGTIGTRYSGWVYLKGQLPDNRFTMNAAGELTPTAPNSNNSRVNAVPCNAGVRIPVAN